MSDVNWTVEHFGLAAADPKALHEWYVRILDADLVWADESVPVYFVKLAGGLILEIYPAQRQVNDVKDNGVGGHRHLALRVDSIESSKVILVERGVEFPDAPKPAGGGGTVLFFADLEGNLIHLVERPTDSVFG